MHSYTKNPEEITRQADIVITAAGVANLVRGSWIKPGAVVIDVGINPVDVRNSLYLESSFTSSTFFVFNVVLLYEWLQLFKLNGFCIICMQLFAILVVP